MTQTAAQALVDAVARLRLSGIDDPARDARKLLAHAAQIEASQVSLIGPDALSKDIAENFETLVRLRSERVPVSHLVGKRAFYGRDFQVSGAVLDPRPDTETLIEAALSEPFGTILDLGTGSGCILVTLLAERPMAVGVGADKSSEACFEASANAHVHDVSGRAQFATSDWFDAIEGTFDLIVSNPPYIAQNEMAGLAPEVRKYEPRMALTDEADGLSCYRIIVSQAMDYLDPKGRLIVEIGPTQGPAVQAMFKSAGFKVVGVIPDLDGRDRVVGGRKAQNSSKNGKK